jgi:RNA polymerase sigma-70 factor (ECF subfamily)
MDELRVADLYERHAQRLLLFLARRTYDAEAALDLTAETFAQAYLRRGRFRGETEDDAVAWLYGIARKQLAMFFRRGSAERRALARLGVERPELTPEEHARIESLAELADLRQAVAAGLERLSGEQRRAVELRVVEERSYAQVAAALDITEQAARARVSRGLRALAAALDAAALKEESHEAHA